MVKEIQSLLADDNVYKKNCKKKRDIMDFEEIRSGLNITSLIKYAANFGTKHLYNDAFSYKA